MPLHLDQTLENAIHESINKVIIISPLQHTDASGIEWRSWLWHCVSPQNMTHLGDDNVRVLRWPR